MQRRAFAPLLLLTLVGCGGAGQQTVTSFSPNDPSVRSNGNGTANGIADAGFKPAAGANVSLGTLRVLPPKSLDARPPEGKVDPNGASKLAKLGKESVKFDDAYRYYVADATSAHASVGEKGASVPLPAEAKPNPDGSYWIVDAETRRLYTLSGVKREEGKDPTATEAPSADLVRPTPDAATPPLALVARPDEAISGVNHALRILAKGVGGEGAPPAGTRVRLKKGVSEKDVPLLAKAVMRALKKYGAVLVPGEGSPSISALADPRWTKEDGKAFDAIHLTDFEIVLPPTPAKKKTAPKTTSKS